MKRIFISLFLVIFGMTVFAQDMSYYTSDFLRPGTSNAERLQLLETIRDSGATGLAEFYHNALKLLLELAPNIVTATEREVVEKSIVILSQSLAAEKYTAAAPELWWAVDFFDVVREANNGTTMQAALIAIGQVNGRDYLPQIVQRLTDYNTQTYRGEQKLRVQMAVIGCVNALEAFKDITGYRPVFFVYVGSYDPNVRQIAYNALPNITDDPGEVISAIISDPSTTPAVKLDAWHELLRTRAPNDSKARVAAVALNTGWNYMTGNRTFQTQLREMRKGAIEIIRQFGVADNSVYVNLEKSYTNNYNTATPDYDEIMLSLNALSAIRSEQAVNLLLKYLRDLHGRRRSGPWGDKERRIYQWVISCIGVTGTRSEDVIQMLTTIERTDNYTPFEQGLARNARTALQQQN
jgi:hypothetical protein